MLFRSVAVMWGGFKQEVKGLRSDLDRLEKKVEKHNSFMERMAVVEQSTRSAHKRIDEVKGEH